MQGSRRRPMYLLAYTGLGRDRDIQLTKVDVELDLGDVGVLCVCESDPLFFLAGLSFLSLSFSFSGGGDARFASRGLGSRSPSSSSRGRFVALSASDKGGVGPLVARGSESARVSTRRAELVWLSILWVSDCGTGIVEVVVGTSTSSASVETAAAGGAAACSTEAVGVVSFIGAFTATFPAATMSD